MSARPCSGVARPDCAVGSCATGRKGAVSLLFLLLVGCGGSGTIEQHSSAAPSYSGKTTPMAVTPASINEVLAGVSDTVPFCSATTTADTSRAAGRGVSNLLKMLSMPLTFAAGEGHSCMPAVSAQRVIPGECGGRITYHDLNFTADGFSGAVSIDGLCSVVAPDTRTVVSGEISFTRSGLTGIFTPWGERFTAESPLLVMSTTTSDGTLLAASTLSFDGLSYERAARSDSPVGSHSELFRLGRLVSTAADRQTMLSNLQILKEVAPDGGTRESISGRLYIGDLGYLDGATGTAGPIVVSPNGTHLSGRILLVGAEGDNLALTLVPGANPTFTFEVDGVVLSRAVLSCLKVYFNERSSH